MSRDPAGLLELVRAELAGVLGHGSAAAVGTDDERTLLELGLGSVAAVQLQQRLTAATGVELPATMLVDELTAVALADALGTALQETPAPSATAAPTTAEPAGTPPGSAGPPGSAATAAIAGTPADAGSAVTGGTPATAGSATAAAPVGAADMAEMAGAVEMAEKGSPAAADGRVCPVPPSTPAAATPSAADAAAPGSLDGADDADGAWRRPPAPGRSPRSCGRRTPLTDCSTPCRS